MTTAVAERIIRYEPKGAILEVFKAHDPEILVVGPAGCVAGETLFLDPQTGIETPIADLVAQRRRPVVQTLDGPVLAEVPFRKGYADLYRVTLASGLSVLATGHHRVLTQTGRWVRVDELRSGDEVPSCERIPLASSWDASPSASLPGAESCAHRDKDSQARCSAGHRLDGALLQSATSSGPAYAPSPVGVLERTHAGWREDDQASREGYSHQDQSSAHLATLDYSPQTDGSVHTLLLRDLETPSHAACLCRGDEPSLRETAPLSPTSESHQDVASMLPASFDSPYTHYRGQRDTVQAVTYERTDWYYDLHVPGAEHYFAQGFWHHNTGKTYGILQLIHLLCLNHPGARVLICRKTLVSLTSTALVTFREKVLTRDDPVQFFGGSHAEPASFRYSNGSRIVVGGMDSPSKILSSEYDIAYVNEATECSEEDIETLTTRLRNGVLRFPRLIMDCNPSYDRHFLLKRCMSGQTRMIKSTHTDNPVITTEYLDTLKRLSGTRLQRLYEGEWVGMENAIYGDLLDPHRLLVEIPQRTAWTGRAGGGMDFGRIHLSAVVAMTQATDGTWWVRECWAEPGGSKAQIMQAVRTHREKYGVRAGVTDPVQEWAAQDLGWKPAKSGAGSRKGRIERVRGLLDTDALRFDVYGPGVQDLWDEMQMYRYEIRETDTLIEDVVVRKDEDRVAALEYAVESIQTALNVPSFGVAHRQPVMGMRRPAPARSQIVKVG